MAQPDAGSAAGSERRPAHTEVAEPRSPPRDMVFSRFRAARVFFRLAVMRLGVPVGAPLPDVAVHVVEPPGVGFLLPDRVCGVAAVVRVPSIVAQLPPVVAETVSGCGSGPAGVFPLCLGRQPELLVRPGRDPFAEYLDLGPTDLFYRVRLAFEFARVRPHDRCILFLGDGVDAQVERSADGHLVLVKVAGQSAFLVPGAPHDELACRDVDQGHLHVAAEVERQRLSRLGRGRGGFAPCAVRPDAEKNGDCRPNRVPPYHDAPRSIGPSFWQTKETA